MKTATQKLKKLKTKKVYGFKSDHFNMIVIGMETTTLPTSSSRLM